MMNLAKAISIRVQRWRRLKLQRYARTEAAQIVELAVSLPLLVVIAIGITDFGGAVNLKHKLAIAAREAARLASNQSSADLTNPTPLSVDAVRDIVESNLLAVEVNDCGLAAATPTKTALAWTYTANAGCAGTLTLAIDRGSTFLTTGGPPVTVEATHVSISYPYQWRFNRVIQLVAPGATFAGVSQLTADAIMQNLD